MVNPAIAMHEQWSLQECIPAFNRLLFPVMSDTQYILEASSENFPERVLANSRKGPVLVNYWSPKAGPCLKLWPTLEQLAHEYQGRFLLVNINTDQEPELARRYGVNSIPTVKLFRHEKVVDQVHGADSLATYRRMLERQLNTVTDPVVLDAIRLYQQGETETAIQLLANAMQSQPGLQCKLTYIKLLFREGHYQALLDTVEKLPIEERTLDEVQALRVHSQFMLAGDTGTSPDSLDARLAENPDDLDARLTLCALALRKDDFAGALEQLLEIMQRDRKYRDDIGRRGMIVLVGMLGNEHELSKQYVKQMQALLHYN